MAVTMSISVSNVRAGDFSPPVAKESKIEKKKDAFIAPFVFEISDRQADVLVVVRSENVILIEPAELANYAISKNVSEKKKEEACFESYYYPTNHDRQRTGFTELFVSLYTNRRCDPTVEKMSCSGYNFDPGLLSA